MREDQFDSTAGDQLRAPVDPVHEGDAEQGLAEESWHEGMREDNTSGRLKSPPSAAVLSSANRTSGGNSTAQTVPNANPPFKTLNVYINLTTLTAGTSPTVTASIQWSDDGSTWYDVDGATDSFTAISAVGSKMKSVTIKAPYWRLVTGVTGAPTNATYGATARYLP
jgi:hypothetical protein